MRYNFLSTYLLKEWCINNPISHVFLSRNQVLDSLIEILFEETKSSERTMFCPFPIFHELVPSAYQALYLAKSYHQTIYTTKRVSPAQKADTHHKKGTNFPL